MSVETESFLNKWTEQPVSYNKRDLLTYAVGIGCTELPFVYENHSDFSAFPTYPIVLGFKGTDQDVVSFPSPAMMEAPPMPPLPGVKVGLDGERYIEKVNEIDVEGAELVLRSRLIAVTKRGSGASVETESELVDKSGKVFYRMISGGFMVGAKDFKDGGRSQSVKIDLPKRAPDAVEEMPTSLYQTHVYRLSGDYNALHIDPEFATMSGFGEPILHGLCSMGITCRAALARYANNDSRRFKALRVRFASPVLPGQTLQVNMWKDGNRILLETKVKETGKVVINNAYLELHPQAKL
eukprot:CAMPEP_0114548002 /NCGR_PEP_ID=MMETSP0114-20121206/4751_1 /TAXON_ID=31324 /ORGANISM="Goniomonas sp, Strain m" /LENGTH=295 /DNA_ID=CAMNT_0001732567 /DNA_START=14 /DNA_END=901 /DNA_ORIENTATION=-